MSSSVATRDGTADFAKVEDESLRWLAAADARLASRLGVVAAPWMLDRIRVDSVLREDVKAVLRGSSLDVFAFEERQRVLDRAGALVGGFAEGLPVEDHRESVAARPRLERELAQRLIGEERARLDDERHLGDASAALVRGIVLALAAPPPEDETVQRDVWIADHLDDIRGSLGTLSTRGALRDLDTALYPLERALPPQQFPKATAALADLRIAMDSNSRPLAELPGVEDLLRRSGTYLGVAVDPVDLDARLTRIATALGVEIARLLPPPSSLGSGPDSSTAVQGDIEAQARPLLLVADSCPCEGNTLMGRAAPSPERSGLCGALRALSDDRTRVAALIALHDDIVIARTIVTAGVRVRAELLSHPPSETVEDLLDQARTRPIFVLGTAFAAEIVYGADRSEERLACWRRLGDAPLDIVRRECSPARR